MEGAPFLTRAAYEEEISKGTTRELVVATEQQADQRQQSAESPFILQEPVLKANSSSHGYTNLQISQPTIIPRPVIKRGEVSSPSSYASLSAQVAIPQIFPLNTEAEQKSMLNSETDHLSLDILIPAQMDSTQIEREAYQMTEEEDVQLWDSSLNEDCSKKDSGVDNVSMSPTHEHIDTPFIFIVQATGDKDKYTTAMIIQQV